MDHGKFNDFQKINIMLMTIGMLYHDATSRFGLTDNITFILRFIYENGDHCPLSSIYKTTGIRKQTINSSIRKLEADGILYLEQTDGRSKRVILTEKGKALMENTVGQIHAAEVHALDDWSQEEIQTYINMLFKVAGSLKRELDKLDYPES